ncbi:MAG: apolipoprotein D and lipocalin family protein [Flavobacteriales bacterium]|jgi:apolipoprotein D and lipocalin family protein
MKSIRVIFLCAFLVGCTAIPENIKPVSDFELDKYMGKWYEIARLDHVFERGLDQVTAVYSLNGNGSVKVANRGWDVDDKEWSDAVGKARFADSTDVGHLEVAFFASFYGDYIIFELDQPDYQYAWITGSGDTLWFLSRTPAVSDQLKQRFVETITEYGYDADELIFVNQEVD